MSYYAAQLNVTPKYLFGKIKRITGISVSTHINRAATAIIISYRKESNLSISQIAEEMKFTSLSYFSRYCQKNLGKSPREYRLSISVKARDIKD
ncbi:MAG: helix-turn-helix domain-containing protein [Muribaculum sp.]|nr:helix-turn-helix domain-containing protein [Muribaculaceae bacterium]MCM1080748.1 helix-turn-helix domain-containing protein [Muribaculum sp.]